jgi:hypothetical protein
LEKFDSPTNLLKDVTSLFYELASNVVIEKKKENCGLGGGGAEENCEKI